MLLCRFRSTTNMSMCGCGFAALVWLDSVCESLESLLDCASMADRSRSPVPRARHAEGEVSAEVGLRAGWLLRFEVG